VGTAERLYSPYLAIQEDVNRYLFRIVHPYLQHIVFLSRLQKSDLVAFPYGTREEPDEGDYTTKVVIAGLSAESAPL
jgi:hypothetical protein